MTEKFGFQAYPLKGIKKEKIPDVKPLAFLRNVELTARGY